MERRFDLESILVMVPFGIRAMLIVVRSSQALNAARVADEVAAQWRRFVLPNVWDFAAALCSAAVGTLFDPTHGMGALAFFGTLIGLVQVRAYIFGWQYLWAQMRQRGHEGREIR